MFFTDLKDSSQIFIATHSTEFVGRTSERVFLVTAINGATKSQTVTISEDTDQILSEIGLSLNSLLMYDHLVFVEGPSDDNVFTAWAHTLNRSPISSNVGFIHLSGISNFRYYAAKNTLDTFTKRGAKIWFIRDGDETPDDEIKKLKEVLEDHAKLIVLTKRQLENYMLIPSAIERFIRDKISKSGTGMTPPNDKEISQVLKEAIKAHKTRVVNLKMTEFFGDSIVLRSRRWGTSLTSADDICKELKERIDTSMTKLQARLKEIDSKYFEFEKQVNSLPENELMDQIPGHLLLDYICKKYGLSFQRKRDSQKLASFFLDKEIHNEVKDIIMEIFD